MHFKINIEKVIKQLEIQVMELSHKLEESVKIQIEISSQKSKLQTENSNILSQLEEAESHISGFAKIKQQLQAQIEEARRLAEDEARSRNSASQQLRSLSQDFESVKQSLEEEVQIKLEYQKTITKITSELQMWRSKYETEGLARAEELEEAKRKLAAKLAEAEEQVEQALAKCNSLEKVLAILTFNYILLIFRSHLE